jgi:hypothetical protein
VTRSWTWPAVLVTLIAIAGTPQLARPGYSVDEEFTVFAVRGIADGGLPLLPSGLLYDRGLAYSYAAWTAGVVSGGGLPAYRAISLLSAVGAVIVMFQLIRRLAGARAAILSAVVVAASLPFWATATTARFYAPFAAAYLATLLVLSNFASPARTFTIGAPRLLLLGLAACLCRLTHELAFTLAAFPFAVAVLGPRRDRTAWFQATAAVVAGLGAAQVGIFLLHYLAPSSGETMVRRFFLWQLLNLFEAPGTKQFGVALLAMLIGWLIAPSRAVVITVLALCAAAMVAAFSIAQATNSAPLTPALVSAVIGEGTRYPLDMFRHIAAANPVAMVLALAGIVARLAGAGGPWPAAHRACHLAWIGWVLWFGVIESGITMNYLLLPVMLMLAAIAVDADAIVRHRVDAATTSGRAIAVAVLAAFATGIAADQWRGDGLPGARLDAARPTITMEGLDEIRNTLQPSDRVACTDELACLLLVGRVDAWLALDDFVRERFVVRRGDEHAVGVYAGAPAFFAPRDLFAPDAAGRLPDRVIVVDVFKEYPIGSSRSWLPRAIERDGLEVTPLLETAQGRVLQISPQEGYAGLQP